MFISYTFSCFLLWKPGLSFTAVKRTKERHFRFLRDLKFESVQTFTSAKFV